MLTAALFGLLLGLRHATDPDHVVAVSALLARGARRWEAVRVGLAWGMGHGATVLAVGGVLVGLGLGLPETLYRALEAGVAVMLLVLGVANLRGARRAAPATSLPLRSGARSFGVGAVHGLAGSGAAALLALAAMPSPAAALLYLLVFAGGNAVAMAALSLGLGVPLSAALGRPGARRWVLGLSGTAALGYGGLLLWDVGTAQGLL